MTLTHNGYTGYTQYCTTDNIYFGKLLHIDDLVCYDTHTEAELKVAVNDYLSVLELFKQ